MYKLDSEEMELEFNNEDIQIANNVAIEHQNEILNILGFHPDRCGNIKCPCPIHGGDNPNGFTFDSRRSIWRCWTHHCHDKFGCDMIGLIRAMMGGSLGAAIQFVKNLQNGEWNADGINIQTYLRTKIQPKEHQIFDLSKIKDDAHNVEYFLKRGLSLETLKKFKAFFCQKHGNNLFGRACLPIFNKDNQVVGFTGRDPTDKQQIKWVHSPKGLPIGQCLFGWQLAADNIKKAHTAILVEGPLDVMKFHECGLNITVAPFGTNLTLDQIKLLISKGVKSLILALDPDTGGDKGTDFIVEKAKLFFNLYDIRNLLNSDPSDMSLTDILSKIKPEVDTIINNTKAKYMESQFAN